MAALAITSLLSSLDAAVLSTALPTIVKDLNSSDVYVWTINAYFLTMTCFQPLYGQTSNIFGRRWLMIGSVVFFGIGSAICGSAKTTTALIAGRAIQGVGGGGINVMVDIIVSDIIPLRERPKYMGMIFVVFALGTSLGPFIGGALTQHVSWSWIFYINLPIVGASLILLVLFLHVDYKPDKLSVQLKRVDWLGNGILILSVMSILLALTWGGTTHPWSSWRTILPLVLGFLGMVAFFVYEASSYVKEATMPLHLFSNRTSASVYAITFLHSIITYWVVYYLPVYFQAVLEASPTASGVDLLPTAVASIPFAIISGIAITKMSKYRPSHFVSLTLIAIGLGLFTRLDQHSSVAYWVVIQILVAAGLGVMVTATLPAIQAPLEEKDVATSTATWAFLRSFGAIWGAAIPTSVFNTRINNLLPKISSEPIRELLKNGGAYSLASKDFILSLNETPEIKEQVVQTYIDALKLVWQVSIAFGVLGFVIAFFVKEVPMREVLDTEFGITEKKKEAESGESV
ncbi:multidrug resistance protein Fnx1 [Rhexocercosporidium sp. MPI-PUGE-AT-0058]|nr:multidrug resistance protein Fnx1 [Rhexocercosporidium sp. MPI-PUGE-AT-0058]